MEKVLINKRRIAAISLISLLFALGLIPAGTAMAEGVVINEDINKAAGSLEIPRGTTVNGNVTLNLGELTVLGVVNGNINSNMGQVIINGDVGGDVEANMGQVLIKGNIGGDVMARMGEVIVDGSIGGNLNADLGATRINGTVGGNIGSGFGEVLIKGAVAGDVRSKGGIVTIDGIVEGDVILEQGLVELGPDAVVSGRIKVGRGQVNIASTAVAGPVEIDEEISPSVLQEQEDGRGYYFEGIDRNIFESVSVRVFNTINRISHDIFGFGPHMFRARHGFNYPYPLFGFYGNLARGLINMLIMFALAVLTYTLFPAQVRASGEALTAKTGPVIGWGILAAVLTVPLVILLAITIIGIPLIIVLIVILAAAAILGYTGITRVIGSRILGAASAGAINPLVSIALGALILGLISMIPVFGGLVSLTVIVLALGAAFTSRFGSVKPGVVELSPPDTGSQE